MNDYEYKIVKFTFDPPADWAFDDVKVETTLSYIDLEGKETFFKLEDGKQWVQVDMETQHRE